MIDHRYILSAHPLADIAASARSRSVAGKALRFCVSALLSGALLWPMPPAVADFIQSGPKLVGTGAVGPAEQGYSVPLSAHRNTPITARPRAHPRPRTTHT